MDSDNDGVAEKDPTGRYIRYHEMIETDALFKQYKAFDENHGVEVSWNQVSIDDGLLSPDQLQLLCEEINLLKSLKHENVAGIHEYWIDDKNRRMNMITESFASGSLREYLTRHKKFNTKVIKNWARQILRGMHYLHTHNPPVFLRDLTCDKMFVNGNNGEVKIGTNYGLATLKKQQATVQNNQLHDLHSFGICMVEMITCENPYTDATLSRVFDPQAKHFIEKCLSMRLSAIELLKHPFLAAESYKVESQSSEVTDMKKKKKKKKKKKIMQLASSGKKAYGLIGMRIDERSVSFTLDVVNKSSGDSKKIEFPFYVDSDTPVSVAEEMICQLDFSGEDVAIVVGLIDALLLELVCCSNNNAIVHKAIRQQNNLLSAKEKECFDRNKFGSEEPTNTWENPRLLSDRDEDLKVKLDAIDLHYVKSFQQLLKNISII